MINKSALTFDWLQKTSDEYKISDKILIEKTLRALLLLEGLAKQKLSFVFKGGTALMLMLSSAKRLSIDIDIIIENKPENLEDILDKVAEEQGFIRKELQNRKTDTAIKKAHYKFFYKPIHQSAKAEEESVLLDILFEKVHYSKIQATEIRYPFTNNIGNHLVVNTPSIEDILGDKLTAFAPNTTGIPYFKNEESMSMEIIKQLYDIGNLFDLATDARLIQSTFFKFTKVELAYRNFSDKTEKDVLEDIFQTALCIVRRGEDGKGDFKQLQTGIKKIVGFIFSEKFDIDKAIVAASKAAYLAILIKNNIHKIEKFENPLQIKDWMIESVLNTKLNKLKKSNPESFFYWFRIYEIVK